MRQARGPGPRRPRITLDCEDSYRSRGLLLISALHMVAPALRDYELVAANAGHPVVRAALASLTWETGLGVDRRDEPVEIVLEHAVLFVAIAVRDTGHLPLGLASERDIPCLVPVQFPRDGDGVAGSVLRRAAHDPRCLADRIREGLAR